LVDVVLLIALVVLGVLALVSAANRRTAQRRRRQEVSAQQLAEVKTAADDDVTEFGARLQRLDTDIAGRDLDEATRQDYQRALDSYDDAKRSVDAITSPDEIRHVTEILEDGRYAVACVEARASAQPLPQRRSPCFFNPQHGPSVRDVSWTPDRGSSRQVPACAADAERVEAGAEPDSRTVMQGSRRVPYWQAGPAYAPFAAGYFGGFGLMEGLFIGTMIGPAFGLDGGYDQGYDAGYDAGQDGGSGADGSNGSDGGSDGGGYDGGSDNGGYDSGGGFDGGGYDSGGGFDGGGFGSGGGFDGGGFDGGGFDGGGF
jgi:type II secretory pathway pseudopilin PulG